MKVSAVLVKYQRPDEIKKIIKHLQTYDFIDEILVHDNSKKTNIMCYGRYKTALKAKNETIYVQDDDCIVDVQKLYDRYDKSKLVNGMKEEGLAVYYGVDSMVGWGTFFEKSWIKVLDKYIKKFGEDHVLIREADRVFTGLLERETVIMDVKDFPSATADYAMYKQPEHYSYKALALERLREIL